MSYRSFGGESTRVKKVSLAGRSRAEETAQQVLERTRLQRERRRQDKLEQKSATAIQVCVCVSACVGVWLRNHH